MTDDKTNDQTDDQANDQTDESAAENNDNEKLQQEVTITDAGPSRKKIVIEIPGQRIADKIAESFNSLMKESTIPGFRRGRAPMRLLEKRFGDDVQSEVKNQIIGESYSQVIEENDMRILGEPDIKDIDDIQLPEDGPMTIEIEVEVSPEFELPDLTGTEVKKQAFEITDDQVAAEIDRHCETYGQYKAVEEQCKARDYITATVEVKNADGQVIEKSDAAPILVTGKERDFKGVVVGVLISDLGKQLAGKHTGDTVTIETPGPERHENEQIQGAEKLVIDINISRIERLQPMPIEELLAMSGTETEEELREQIKTSLDQKGKATQQADMHKQVSDILVEKIDIELPEQLSSRQTENILRRKSLEMMYQGASKEDVDQGLAELRAASQEEAQQELKLFFILDKVAQKFDIEVAEAELNGRIAMMAMQSGSRPEKQRQEMQQNGQLDQLYIQMRETKAIDKLIEDMKVVNVAAERDDAHKKTTKKTTTKKTTTKKSTTKKTTAKKSTPKKKSDDSE